MDTVELENKRLLKDKPEDSNIDDESWIRFYRVVDNLRMLNHLLEINEKECSVESPSHDIPLPPEDDE